MSAPEFVKRGGVRYLVTRTKGSGKVFTPVDADGNPIKVPAKPRKTAPPPWSNTKPGRPYGAEPRQSSLQLAQRSLDYSMGALEQVEPFVATAKASIVRLLRPLP